MRCFQEETRITRALAERLQGLFPFLPRLAHSARKNLSEKNVLHASSAHTHLQKYIITRCANTCGDAASRRLLNSCFSKNTHRAALVRPPDKKAACISFSSASFFSLQEEPRPCRSTSQREALRRFECALQSGLGRLPATT